MVKVVGQSLNLCFCFAQFACRHSTSAYSWPVILFPLCTGNMHSTVTEWNLRYSASCARSRKKPVMLFTIMLLSVLMLAALAIRHFIWNPPCWVWMCGGALSLLQRYYTVLTSCHQKAIKHTLKRKLTPVVSNTICLLAMLKSNRKINIIRQLLYKMLFGIRIETSVNSWANRQTMPTGQYKTCYWLVW